MATDNSAPQAPKTVKIKRFQIGVNVLIQLVILLMIFVMVNYVAFHHYKRWDKSRNQKNALSEKTKRVLESLKKPVKAYIFFSSASEIFIDLDNVLKEYQYYSKGKLTVEIVDPARDFSRARDLQAKYKFGANENIVILDCDGRTKFVNAADMADYDTTGEMYGQPPRLKAFKGEQAVTSGLIEISQEKQSKLYTVKGQGEREIDDPAYKGIKTFIGRENIKIESLDLQNVAAVPEDAKALLIMGPRYDFSEREIKMLRDYWDKKGRMFILLDPNASTPHLAAFLADQGIKPQDDRILRTLTVRQLTGLVNALLRDVTGNFIEGSPVTKRLKGVNGLFLGGTQSLALDRQRAQVANVRLQMLVRASEGYWGKTDYNIREGDEVFFDSRKDHGQPLAVVVSAEKGALSDPKMQVDSSRMIVAGNCEFLSDASLSEANANLDFGLSAVDWLIDREELIGVAPKVNRAFSLNLSDAQVSNIFLLSIGAIPGAVALFGFGLWWKRRH